MSDPCTATERAGLIVWLFASGGKYTSLEVACRLDVSISQARRILITLARVTPLYRDETDGKWQFLKT